MCDTEHPEPDIALQQHAFPGNVHSMVATGLPGRPEGSSTAKECIHLHVFVREPLEGVEEILRSHLEPSAWVILVSERGGGAGGGSW